MLTRAAKLGIAAGAAGAFGLLLLVVRKKPSNTGGTTPIRTQQGIAATVKEQALGQARGPVESFPTGQVQFYDGGTLGPAVVSKRTNAYQAFFVRDSALEVWLKTGGPLGPLGLQRGRDYPVPGGTRIDFEDGYLIWERADVGAPWFGVTAYDAIGAAIMGAKGPYVERIGIAGRIYGAGSRVGIGSVTREVSSASAAWESGLDAGAQGCKVGGLMGSAFGPIGAVVACPVGASVGFFYGFGYSLATGGGNLVDDVRAITPDFIEEGWDTLTDW